MEQAATLVAHNPKFGSQMVTREQLKSFPTPPATSHWRPIPHAELVASMLEEIEKREWQVKREQYAVSKTGMALFGAIDLEGGKDDRGMALGFRHSNDKALAVQIVGGARVFVCDNLTLSGEKIALRKHSRSLHLRQVIREGFNKWLDAYKRFDQSIVEAEHRVLSDDEAKVTLFDLRYDGILPVSIFDDVANNYFRAETLGYTDSAPRTSWGLHNACTRAVKALAPASQFRILTDLGKAFKLGGS